MVGGTGSSVRVSARWLLLLAIAVLAGDSMAQPLAAEPTSRDDERLRRALERFPEADADRDGVLTLAEARAYLEKRRAGQTSSRVQAPVPTFENVRYGPHDRNVLDFWQAKRDKPTPVVVYIHGGGFVGGDKSSARTDVRVGRCLAAGVSFAAINYRFLPHAPIQQILRDAGRAVQFIRHQAGEWNIDKVRIAAYGGSAGAGTSLWLATHDDLADPKSPDPVLRESSRLSAAAMVSGQATYDLTKWEAFLGPAQPEYFKAQGEVPGFYHLKTMADLETAEARRILADCDMLGLITKDDAPLFATCAQPDGPAKDRGHYLHHPNHAREVKKRYDAAGVECVALLGMDARRAPADALVEFLLKHLGVPPAGGDAAAEG